MRKCFLLFIGTPLFMTSDRIPFLDYMPLNTPTKGKFIFRAPQLSAGRSICQRWLIESSHLIKENELKLNWHLCLLRVLGETKVFNIFSNSFQHLHAPVSNQCLVLMPDFSACQHHLATLNFSNRQRCCQRTKNKSRQEIYWLFTFNYCCNLPDGSLFKFECHIESTYHGQ